MPPPNGRSRLIAKQTSVSRNSRLPSQAVAHGQPAICPRSLYPAGTRPIGHQANFDTEYDPGRRAPLCCPWSSMVVRPKGCQKGYQNRGNARPELISPTPDKPAHCGCVTVFFQKNARLGETTRDGRRGLIHDSKNRSPIGDALDVLPTRCRRQRDHRQRDRRV
jgi:hypothetical protein